MAGEHEMREGKFRRGEAERSSTPSCAVIPLMVYLRSLICLRGQVSWGFERGRVYTRRADIHARFGGQQQGGIITPAQHALVIIITGEEGLAHGYADRRRSGWGVRIFRRGPSRPHATGAREQRHRHSFCSGPISPSVPKGLKRPRLRWRVRLRELSLRAGARSKRQSTRTCVRLTHSVAKRAFRARSSISASCAQLANIPAIFLPISGLRPEEPLLSEHNQHCSREYADDPELEAENVIGRLPVGAAVDAAVFEDEPHHAWVQGNSS